MASRGNPAETRRPAPRLYLTHVVGAAGAAALADALRAADVAAVLVSLPAADERSLINHVKALAPTVQGCGAALVLAGHAEIAAKAGADGAHLADVDEFQAALEFLKPDRIAGCGGLATRHDAMLAAETGADYVMFGEPAFDGERPSFDAVLERVAWWAEVFEIPCVGFAASLDEVEPLVAAGADFVALGDWVFGGDRDPASTVAEAAARLVVTEPAT
jgi:thiamine-phosphate pyrophosphorylase